MNTLVRSVLIPLKSHVAGAFISNFIQPIRLLHYRPYLYSVKYFYDRKINMLIEFLVSIFPENILFVALS